MFAKTIWSQGIALPLLAVAWLAGDCAWSAPVEQEQAVGSVESSAPEAVPVYTVRTESVPATVSVGGTVVPRKVVTMAAQLPGRVEYLAGEEGDRFKKGTLLVRLDDNAGVEITPGEWPKGWKRLTRRASAALALTGKSA